MAERFRNSRRILCSYCLESSVLAIKKCVRCDAFLCSHHLGLHSKSRDHVLLNVMPSPVVRECSQHKREFAKYCATCNVLCCLSCLAQRNPGDSLITQGSHDSHVMWNLDHACSAKKDRLKNTLEILKIKLEDIPNRVQQLETVKARLTQKIADVNLLLSEGDHLAVLLEQESDLVNFCDVHEDEKRFRQLQCERNLMVDRRNMVIMILVIILFFLIFILFNIVTVQTSTRM